MHTRRSTRVLLVGTIRGKHGADAIPGELAVVVTPPGGDQVQAGGEFPQRSSFRLIVLGVKDLQTGQSGVGKSWNSSAVK